MPLLLVPRDRTISPGEIVYDKNFLLKNPFFNKYKNFTVQVYKEVTFLYKDWKGMLMKPQVLTNNNCYFGISLNIKNYGTLKEENAILNDLQKNSFINKKIFSFNDWDITTNPKKPQTFFNLGESYEVFNSNTGIIGTCKSNPEDNFWGCSFKEMKFNNINIPLINNNTEKYYKIYIASETHNIILPTSFKDFFADNSNTNCTFNHDNFLYCTNFFNKNNYVALQLTEENDQFVITGEVDNMFRFNEYKEEEKSIARVKIQEDLDYIILPLIVFKKFHVQFNGENNEISFYTTDSNLLQVKTEKKDSSSGLKVFIIILIILIVVALCFGIYWLIKKKRTPESSINKFSKFEDEESYHNLNGNKVF